jgi:hypothetical protein
LGFSAAGYFIGQGLVGIFSNVLKFHIYDGVGIFVLIYWDVLPVRICMRIFPVCTMFPVFLITFSPDWFVFFGVQI